MYSISQWNWVGNSGLHHRFLWEIGSKGTFTTKERVWHEDDLTKKYKNNFQATITFIME